MIRAMLAFQVVVWTCVSLFVVTSVIVILALVSKIGPLGGGDGSKHDYYLNKLFTVLILEVAISAVGAFGLYLKQGSLAGATTTTSATSTSGTTTSGTTTSGTTTSGTTTSGTTTSGTTVSPPGVSGPTESPNPPKLKPSDGGTATHFPIFVSARMLVQCATRAGDVAHQTKPQSCAPPNAQINLGGTVHTRGVIYTQTYAPDNSGIAVFNIPRGSGHFAYSVGNYTPGVACGGQTPMNWLVLIDDQKRDAGNAGQVISRVLDLDSHAHQIKLIGSTSDHDVRCDDLAWGSVRFEK
jgi:hypothetical protein